MFWKKKITIVTHSGSFHADDVFACASLALYFKQKHLPYRIIRTRDPKVIEQGDLVVDVGTIYDPTQGRFDHHQPGGAGSRENGIPYAAFGLVWQHYGPLIAGDEEIAAEIDRRLVQPIDAIDNGISLHETADCNALRDYGIHGIVGAFESTWKQAGDTRLQDESFLELVVFFSRVLERELVHLNHRQEMVHLIQEAYDTAPRKDIIEVPYHVGIGPLMQVFEEQPEVKYVVAKSNTNWKAMSLRKEPCSFESRVTFPKSWAGKRNEELQTISGVPDALFCHNALFLAVAESREGAWALAKKSLEEASNQA